MKFRTILLFGAPGTGKGTQGKVLGTIPGFFHTACGDLFRSLNHDTPLGRVFLDYSSRGELVPDEPTVALWKQYLTGCIKSGRFNPAETKLVLDGIPRNLHQAQILVDDLDVVAIFYLKCKDEDNLVHRMQRRALKENRLDDANVDVIRTRLETYESDSKQVLGFYDKRVIHRIDADQPPVKVLHQILQRVEKL